MKSIKTAVFGAMTLVATATLSHAQTEFYFTGSTAFRAAAVDAIHNIFDSGSLTFGYTGTVETKQDAGVYSGSVGGVAYIIKTNWTGSEAGIQAVADSASLTIPYCEDTPTVATVATALTTAGLQNIDDPTVAGGTGTFVPETAQVDMADTWQASSQFRANHPVTYVSGVQHTFATLTGTQVGVVPFTFVISQSGTATVNNISDPQIRNLYGNGYLPRSLFSGVNADETSRTYATGRNPDSGTRVTTLIDTGIGAAGSQPAIIQYEPTNATGGLISAVGSTVASVVLWPVDTVNSVLVAANQSGFNSGGKLAGAIGSVTTAMVSSDNVTGGDLLGYLSTSDAATAVGGGAKILTYNGVSESNTTVEEGAYTFFSFEHLYYNAGTLPSNLVTLAKSIASSIAGTYASASGVPLGSMNVHRFGTATETDGGAIVPNYSY
jgi:hypothetical protein